jgi:ATP-binding cassette, subfamily B, bacterial MsbA
MTVTEQRLPTDTITLAKRLLHDSLRWPIQLAIAVVSGLLLGFVQLYITWLVKRWMEWPVSSDLNALQPLRAPAAIAILVGAVTVAFSRYFITSVNQLFIERVRNEALGRVLALEYPVASALPDGDLMARFLHDTWMLSGFLENLAYKMVRDGIIGVGAVVMLFVLNWRLALTMFAVVPPCAILLILLGTRIQRWRFSAHQEIGKLGAMLNEQLDGLSTIKIFQTERAEARRFHAQHARCRRGAMRAELWAVALLGTVFLVTGIGLLGVIEYGTRQLASGTLDRAALLAFCLYAAQIVEPVRRISETHGFLQAVVAAAARVYQVVDHPGLERRSGGSMRLGVVPDIQCAAVRFSYDGQPAVLSDLNLHVPAREHLALVGATGSGKTTLLRLLVGFYAPATGSIYFDGVSISSARIDDLRRIVCCVEQEPFLFSGTVLENVSYGSPHADERSARDALALVGLDAAVDVLPDGLHTVLSEARQLSGGERQRLALARAIVRDPAVLILDEATSAIDSETEVALFDRMNAWLQQRTVVAVAHRLSTVRRFPRIVLLENGRLVADGTPERLLRANPAFVSLFADQLESAVRDDRAVPRGGVPGRRPAG